MKDIIEDIRTKLKNGNFRNREHIRLSLGIPAFPGRRMGYMGSARSLPPTA